MAFEVSDSTTSLWEWQFAVGRNADSAGLASQPMATAVTIDEETESLLEELRAEIERETGETVTQQALLAALVRSAADSPREFVDSFREITRGVSREELDVFNSGMGASGVQTDESDIDDILYS